MVSMQMTMVTLGLKSQEYTVMERKDLLFDQMRAVAHTTSLLFSL